MEQIDWSKESSNEQFEACRRLGISEPDADETLGDVARRINRHYAKRREANGAPVFRGRWVR